MPWFVLALLYAAFYARMTRGNLIEAMGEDYIRTARAKGLSERKVVVKHGLRASLTPIVTMFGMDIALLIGGASSPRRSSTSRARKLGRRPRRAGDLPPCSA